MSAQTSDSDNIDLTHLDNFGELQEIYYSTAPNELAGADREDRNLLRQLAMYGQVEINGSMFTGAELTFSLSALKVFHNRTFKFKGEPVRVVHSAMGVEDISIDNLSVIADGVKLVSGVGTKLASEWWEKKNGTDVITLKVGKDFFACIFILGKWTLRRCSTFLYEGAEYENGVIWLREELSEVFSIDGVPCKVKQVQKFSFDTPCDGEEGVIIAVDFKYYRIKKCPTIDLIVRQGKAYSSSGNEIFLCPSVQDGISEFTLQGGFVKVRPDKFRPDTDHKIRIIKESTTLAQFQTLLRHLDASGEYIPSQHIGFEHFHNYEGDCRALSVNLGWQIMSPDLIPFYEKSKHESLKTPILLKDHQNFQKLMLDYRSVVNSLKRRGYSFNVGCLRRDLMDKGFVFWYGQVLGISEDAYVPVGHPIVSCFPLEPKSDCIGNISNQMVSNINERPFSVYPTSMSVYFEEFINATLAKTEPISYLWKSQIRVFWYPSGILRTVLDQLILDMVDGQDVETVISSIVRDKGQECGFPFTRPVVFDRIRDLIDTSLLILDEGVLRVYPLSVYTPRHGDVIVSNSAKIGPRNIILVTQEGEKYHRVDDWSAERIDTVLTGGLHLVWKIKGVTGSFMTPHVHSHVYPHVVKITPQYPHMGLAHHEVMAKIATATVAQDSEMDVMPCLISDIPKTIFKEKCEYFIPGEDKG
jgi:hypothetical protein